MLRLFCYLFLCMSSTHQTLHPFQQSYLWQSVLGKLHWVESISFIGHIMDRLATYWHLEKQYSALCSTSHFGKIFINFTVYTDYWQHVSNSLNHHQNSEIATNYDVVSCSIIHDTVNFNFMPSFPRIMATFS